MARLANSAHIREIEEQLFVSLVVDYVVAYCPMCIMAIQRHQPATVCAPVAIPYESLQAHALPLGCLV
jgi:hypothetical protein